MAVRDAHDAEAVVEVDVLVAVDVPDARALAVGEVDGARLAGLKGARNAPGADLDRRPELRLRAAGALQEAGALALGEIAEPAAVDGRSGSRHAPKATPPARQH